MDTTLIDKIINENPDLAEEIEAKAEARIKETYKKIAAIQKEIQKEETNDSGSEHSPRRRASKQ